MEGFIVSPLKATHIQTLTIINAIDECKDKGSASALLSVLARYVHEIPASSSLSPDGPDRRSSLAFVCQPSN